MLTNKLLQSCSLKIISVSCFIFFVTFHSFSQTNKDTIEDPAFRNKIDSFKISGYVSATGLIESGDENKNVLSLLSLITMGNSKYQVEPLTSLAYSNKPGAQIEGEYLENVIIRYHQQHLLYPALGLSGDKSFLRKINYRVGIGATIVCNLLNKNDQVIKLGIGFNHEFTQYIKGAFVAEYIPGNNSYSRSSNQVYIRLKGKNNLFLKRFILSYDFFYQPSVREISDYRWTLIGNLDIPLTKRVDFRSSMVSSYESFVATKVASYNFRLTFGASVSF